MTVVDKIREIFSQEMDIDIAKLPPDRRLVTLYQDGHADSLAMIEIVLALEEQFEIDIPDEDVAPIEDPDAPHTIADVAAYVEKRRAEILAEIEGAKRR